MIVAMDGGMEHGELEHSEHHDCNPNTSDWYKLNKSKTIPGGKEMEKMSYIFAEFYFSKKGWNVSYHGIRNIYTMLHQYPLSFQECSSSSRLHESFKAYRNNEGTTVEIHNDYLMLRFNQWIFNIKIKLLLFRPKGDHTNS